MKREMSSIPKSKLILPVAGRDHIRGPIDAPMTLVEYGDYQCPYCGAAHAVVKEIQQESGDRLCFAFRNFPLTNVHPYAEHAAEAAEAAADQGKFWEMHDLLFENQEALDDDALVEYARQLGLDPARFRREVVARAHASRVREDSQTGMQAGVEGTPTFFVNGVRYEGESDAESLLAALDHL
jgi:protein-disulfide isomerase